MENSKLMTPLFYDGMFNRDGRRMRAVLEREISDGTQTYRLWRSAGAPDLDYPRAENDKYILHVEVNGYLAPLDMTDFALTDICGLEPAAKALYGGKEKREEWFDRLRKSGGYDAVSAAIAEEQNEIERYGSDPVRRSTFRTYLMDISALIKRQRRTVASHSPISLGRWRSMTLPNVWSCLRHIGPNGRRRMKPAGPAPRRKKRRTAWNKTNWRSRRSRRPFKLSGTAVFCKTPPSNFMTANTVSETIPLSTT